MTFGVKIEPFLCIVSKLKHKINAVDYTESNVL